MKKKILKKNKIIFLSGLVLIFLAVSFTFPTFWGSQIVSKYILDRENLLEKIEFKGDCEYSKAKTDIVMGSRNPGYDCISYNVLTSEERSEEVSRIADILRQEGWAYNMKTNNYYKDNLKFSFSDKSPTNVYGAGMDYHLTLFFSHMSLKDDRDYTTQTPIAR